MSDYEQWTDELARHRPLPPELDDAYWQRFEADVMDRVAATPQARTTGGVWPTAFRMAAAIALALIGVVIGRLSAPVTPAAPVAVQADAPRSTTALVQARTERYLQRSKMLLLGVVHFDAATDDPALLNLGEQRQIADDLAVQNPYLQADLEAADMDRLRRLVADLEIVLLQLANLESDTDVPGLELARAGAEARGLLLKINLEELAADARTATPLAQPLDL